jgi:hypothetical protein
VFKVPKDQVAHQVQVVSRDQAGQADQQELMAPKGHPAQVVQVELQVRVEEVDPRVFKAPRVRVEHQDQVVSRDQVAHQVQQELMAPKGHQEQADLKELLAIKDRVELRVLKV